MRGLLALMMMLAVACSASGPASAAADTTAARADVKRIEGDARALAKTDGCKSADECRVAPVGDRACGGPRTYVAYCSTSTDSSALYRKLDDLKLAEQKLNKLTNATSTCEFRAPPVPGFVGGHCTGPP